ncbi:hypothetical protein, partial [Streptomyces sp. NPDC054784]
MPESSESAAADSTHTNTHEPRSTGSSAAPEGVQTTGAGSPADTGGPSDTLPPRRRRAASRPAGPPTAAPESAVTTVTAAAPASAEAAAPVAAAEP